VDRWDRGSYLLILRAHLADQHGHVVVAPHPGVTGEILQHHHGFVEASDRLHHPVTHGGGTGKKGKERSNEVRKTREH